MSQRHFRILAIIDPLPTGEETVRHFAPILRHHQPREILWVTLCDDFGMGFESCHVPFMTPMEWLQRTEADLASRLTPFLQRLGMRQTGFRLLPGTPNQAVATLAEEWSADMILTTRADANRVTGHDAPAWLRPPWPLPCALHSVEIPSPWRNGMRSWLHHVPKQAKKMILSAF